MSLTSYIRKRLADLLEEHRVVVWYDGEQAFGEIAQAFALPSCRFVSAVQSQLSARRQADELVRFINDPARPGDKNGRVLVYVPRMRGAWEEEQVQDPFEALARIGAAFGVNEAEHLSSLARQAMPQRIAEIDRLFREGRPTVSLLEGLADGNRYPLLEEATGTDSAVEATAQLLCRPEWVQKIRAVSGASDELLRILRAELGFTAPQGAKDLDAFVEALGRYVLFSEFAFDCPSSLPETLAGVTRAEPRFRDVVYPICDRMRGSDDTREGYIRLATALEKNLRLPTLTAHLSELGVRDTFPFEERVYLSRLVALTQSGDLSAARLIVQQRRRSVWRSLPERALLWKLAERCVDFLEAAVAWAARLPKSDSSVRGWIDAYSAADGLWHIDRHQRLVEQGAAECIEHAEVTDLIGLCRQRYREVAETAQASFLQAVSREGWPPEGVSRQTQTFNAHVAPALAERRKVAYFLVDALRYEMGCDLGQVLESFGPVSVSCAATVVPTTTPCGMAALMPGADGALGFTEDSDDLIPAIAGRPLAGSKERMALLKEQYGDRFRDLTLDDVLSVSPKRLQGLVGASEFLVIRTQDIDALGEGPSLFRARKFMSSILEDVRNATGRLATLGFATFVYAADHGHILLPEVPPGDVVTEPPGVWKKAKRRCRLGSSQGSSPGVIVFRASRMGIVGPVQDFVVTTGFRVFSSGEGYFHEGLSLQECLIPVVVLQSREQTTGQSEHVQVEIRYRSESFTSRVIGLKVWFDALFEPSLTIRFEAYDGTGSKAKVVGRAADCDARDSATGLVTLLRGMETQVPLRVSDDFQGKAIEVRAIDPTSGAIFHRLMLKNAVME